MNRVPDLSVVVPTFNRCDVLAATLDALAAQTLDADRWEVVVVDNGSSDGTSAMLDERRATYPVPLRVGREPKPGPAAARNRGVAETSGRLLLLLGDDTPPADPDLLQRHVDLHVDTADEVAVLGRIEWDPAATVTPLMRWLAQGVQFSFGGLQAGPVDPRTNVVSSHLSLKRAMLERVGGFDERYPRAAHEDTDLGTRLAQDGLELRYVPELLVWHRHFTSLDASVRRMRFVGEGAWIYRSIWRERSSPDIPAPRPVVGRLVSAVVPVLLRLEPLVPPAAAPVLWRLLHGGAYATGYRRAESAARHAGRPRPVLR